MLDNLYPYSKAFKEMHAAMIAAQKDAREWKEIAEALTDRALLIDLMDGWLKDD